MDATAEIGNASNLIWDDSTIARGTCGSFRGHGRSGHVSSYTPHAEKFKSDMIPMSYLPSAVNPTVESTILEISQEVEPSNSSSLDVLETQFVGNTQQDSLSHTR